MKIGDVVKLIENPPLDWMEDYRDKTFRVLDFPTETGVELMMIGSRPEWLWVISKTNLELADEAG
tara:strand:- start:2532 stop:2726 length:195 start_codon:yes stop_codon:yes gene_type:complete